MKKATLILTLVMLVMSLTGCKESDTSAEVGISFFSVNPQIITGGETSFISLTVSNVVNQTVLVKALVDRGLANPSITYTTGNPVYIEYFPPDLTAGTNLEAVITIVITTQEGKELDRADARVLVNY